MFALLLTACASSPDDTAATSPLAEYPAATEEPSAVAIEVTGVVENPDNGHAYAVLPRRPNVWRFANTYANRTTSGGRHGHLVTITSAEEQAWIEDNLPAGYYWIGARQNLASPDYSEPAGGWEWVTGEPFDYTNWGSGEPSNCCGGEHWLMVFNTWGWNDNYYNWNYSPSCDGIVVEFE